MEERELPAPACPYLCLCPFPAVVPGAPGRRPPKFAAPRCPHGLQQLRLLLAPPSRERSLQPGLTSAAGVQMLGLGRAPLPDPEPLGLSPASRGVTLGTQKPQVYCGVRGSLWVPRHSACSHRVPRPAAFL